jgi:hypothetical protein
MTAQFHALTALPPGKEAPEPIDKKLDGPQSKSGRYGEVTILDPTRTDALTPRSSIT